MTGAFSVDPTALGAHATALEGTGARLGEASAAASVALSADAYGVICGFLATGVTETGTRLRTVIDRLAGSMTEHADGVRGCLADYRGTDVSSAGEFGGRG